MRGAVLLLALVVVPSASAAFLPTEHVIEWREPVYSTDSLGGWDGDIVAVTVDRPHSWMVVSSTVDVLLSVNMALEGSNAQRSLSISVDGGTLEFCVHQISTEGSLTMRETLGGGGLCPATTSGVARVTIGAEQEWQFTNAGSGTVQFFIASVYVVIQETVTTMTDFEAMTGLTGVEFFAVVGVAAGLLLVGVTTRHVAAKAMCGWLVIVLAVLLLFFHSSAVVVVLAAGLGLGGAVVLLLLALERLKKEPGPRQFFE